MRETRVITLKDFSRACVDCRLQDLCLPVGIPRHEVEQLERIVEHRPLLHRGSGLYTEGDRFGSLYAVRSGSLKSVCVSDDGRKQVTAFHLPGDILGFDAITESRHLSSAVALETTSVCELPFDQLHELAHQVSGLQRQMLRIMSRELGAEERMTRVIASSDAEQRLAEFLLNLGARYGLRGYSSREFRLSMSRRDIASYLGLATETVSRVLVRFQERGLIGVRRSAMKILDQDALGAVFGRASGPAQTMDDRHRG